MTMDVDDDFRFLLVVALSLAQGPCKPSTSSAIGTENNDQLLVHFFLILNIASITLTCTRGLDHVGEFRYLIGLAASAAPHRAASLELGSILAARRDSCAVECSQIVASTAPRRVAVRRIVNQA